jgi:chromosome segregation ATPase
MKAKPISPQQHDRIPTMEEMESLRQEIANLEEQKSLLKKQLEERQEMMQNLFTFVEANSAK